MALDKFALHNKGVEQGDFGFSVDKARFHLRGDDLTDLVTEGCSDISKSVYGLTEVTQFSRPFLYWLFPNCHLVVAINTRDLR